MMKKEKPLHLLRRTDKWYLGGGSRLLWAPEFPFFLDTPGFWDRAHYYNYPLQPLFTWTILDDQGREIELRLKSREWYPAELRQVYVPNDRRHHIEIVESKSVLPNDVAVSVVHLKNKGRKPKTLHLVAWTTQESRPQKQKEWLTETTIRRGIGSFIRHTKPEDRPGIEIACALGLNRKVSSSALSLSEGSAVLPVWRISPLHEKFRRALLQGGHKVPGIDEEGLLSLALHSRLKLRGGQTQTVTIGFSAASTIAEASQNLALVLKQKLPTELSYLSWTDYFSNVPLFECSDEFLTRYYWYRWYGLRLNTIHGMEGNYGYPFVCEGIGYFRAPISYSAPCHMLENRWLHEPDLAQGSLMTFIDNQRDDGGFRGYIDVNHYRQEMFYHANWGKAVLELERIHPTPEFLQAAYEGLKKYAAYFDRERDEEVSGLYDIDNHYETGQEYMHRYLAVEPNADRDNWGNVFRLKGVDVTTYVYTLKQALGQMADRLGKTEEADLWNMEAERTKHAVLETMWDPKEEMFFDVDPSSKQRTKVKAATCFYPYLTDIVTPEHVSGLKRHLFNPREFWTPFPVPSSSVDDDYFCDEPEWKGKRMNCPWNGRVWPMANSHIAEALASAALRFDDKTLKKKTVEFLNTFIRMMFFEGDPKRPQCFEHYNPFTGFPSIYRGIDDYQHSWVNDLIMKYVGGIRPEDHSVTIDPFPFGLRKAVIDHVFVRGRMLRVELHGKKFKVWLDGKHAVGSIIGKPVSIQI